MNRWHCYEFLKRTYAKTGTVPTSREITAALPGLNIDERIEGIEEFRLMMSRRELDSGGNDAEAAI